MIWFKGMVGVVVTAVEARHLGREGADIAFPSRGPPSPLQALLLCSKKRASEELSLSTMAWTRTEREITQPRGHGVDESNC